MSKTFCNIPSLLPFLTIIVLNNEPLITGGINVGTTLFTKADCQRECWSEEGIALLTSRMILEDLLPKPEVLVMDSNEFVNDLVEYFRLILDVIRAEAKGKSKRITLMALTDLLGGYMYHAVLPMAKYSYYAGIIDYESMENLVQLFDELKYFLRTNGRGWAKPMKQVGDNYAIERIVLKKSPKDREDACSGLILRENETSEYGSCGVSVPMPFMDSNNQPVAIAMPYTSCSLFNVGANTSAYIIMKFFIKSYECLVNKNAPPDSMEKFVGDFCVWIEKKVEPRLHDDKFYAAFGGILRVRNTLRRMGVKQGKIEMDSDSDLAEIAGATAANVTGHSESNIFENTKLTKMNMVLFALIATICLWFLLGSTFICYKIRQKKRSPDPAPSTWDEDTGYDYGDQSKDTRSITSKHSSDETTDEDSSEPEKPVRKAQKPRDNSPAKIEPSHHEETGPETSMHSTEGDDPRHKSQLEDSRNQSKTELKYNPALADSQEDTTLYKTAQDHSGLSLKSTKLVQEKSLFKDTVPHETMRHSMASELNEKRKGKGKQSSPLRFEEQPGLERRESNLKLEGDTTEEDNASAPAQEPKKDFFKEFEGGADTDKTSTPVKGKRRPAKKRAVTMKK